MKVGSDSNPILRGNPPDGLPSALTPILELLADERVTEIEANGYDDIWVKGSGWWGHRRAAGIRWHDRADFEIACIRISDVIGRALSKRTPLLPSTSSSFWRRWRWIAGLSSQVVAAMVGRAVDVVIYQRHFEDENVRRIAEVIELAHPGVRFGAGGEIAYETRRLAIWDSDAHRWSFPEEPSATLLRALAAKGVAWLPDGGEFVEPTEIEGNAVAL